MCFIERPVLAKLGFDPRTMPMKPMSVEQCVSEGLNALRENRSRIGPGRLNRFMDAFVPAFVKRTFTAKMLGKALASKHDPTTRESSKSGLPMFGEKFGRSLQTNSKPTKERNIETKTNVAALQGALADGATNHT